MGWLASAVVQVTAADPLNLPNPRAADQTGTLASLILPHLLVFPALNGAINEVEQGVDFSECIESSTVAYHPNPQPAELCADGGGVCHAQGDGTHRCQFYCFEWEDDYDPADPEDLGYPGDYGCGHDGGQNWTYSAVGMYYCPPLGVHDGCDQQGGPTDGRVYSLGHPSRCTPGSACDGGSLAHSFLWGLDFEDGVATNPDQTPEYYLPVARVIHAWPPASGTFGAYFEFIAKE